MRRGLLRRIQKVEAALQVRPEPPPLDGWDAVQAVLTDVGRRLHSWRAYHAATPPHSYARTLYLTPAEAEWLRELRDLARQCDDDEEAALAQELAELALATLPIREPGGDPRLPRWETERELQDCPLWRVWVVAGVRTAPLQEWRKGGWRRGQSQHEAKAREGRGGAARRP